MTNYAELITELADAKYNGLSDAEVVALLKAGTPTVGRIEGSNKLNLIAYEAEQDLQYEAQQVAEDTQNPASLRKLARALSKTLDSKLIMLPDWRINLGDSKVSAMFGNCVMAGLLTETQKSYIEDLATYSLVDERWINVTEKDVYIVRNGLVGTGIFTYNYLSSVNVTLDYIVNGGDSYMSIIIYLDTPAVHNINGTLRFLVANENQTDNESYSKHPLKYAFTIAAGEKSVPVKVSSNGLARFIKAEVEFDINVAATVQVRGM